MMRSSAKRQHLEETHSGMSFMNDRNKIGPRTDPCGTPDVTRATTVNLLSIMTCCVRPVRKSSIDIFIAEHAGVAKRLSKGIADDEERLKWEKDNTDVMRNLLQAKLEQCQEFRSLLIEYADVTLAEATPSRLWATGLSPYMTEHTAPNFWPGNNLLGVMLKELSLGPEESIISDLNQPTPNDHKQHPLNQIQADVIVHQVDVPASQPVSESSSQPTSQSADQPANQSTCQPDAQSNNETVSQAANLPLSSASNGQSTGVSAGESPDVFNPGPTEESAEGLPVNRSRQKHRSPASFRGPRSFSTPRRT